MYELTTDSDSLVLDEREGQTGRDLIIRLLTPGEIADTAQGRESFDASAFADVDPTKVVVESQRHGGPVVGIGTAIESSPEGIYFRARISETADGHDLLTLFRDRVLTAASITFKPTETKRTPEGVLHRLKADLLRVAVLQKGAYSSAQVVAQRAPVEEPPVKEEEPMSTETEDRVTAVEESIRSVQATVATAHTSPNTDVLAGYRSFGEAFLAATDDPSVNEALNRALTEQTTTANPGLIDKINSWELVAPVLQPRRSILAFGGAIALPASGLQITWPSFDPASTFSVARQNAEFEEISSGTVSYKSNSTDIHTYAGGSKVSLQLIQRSDPAYRELLLREYGRAWSTATNAAFVAVIEAGTTTDTLALGADTAALIAALIAQSVAIETDSGAPASVALLATDVWLAVASLPDMIAPQYGTVNAPGVISAATLELNLSGLRLAHEPALSAGKMIVSTPIAASWGEDGPRALQSLDVSVLGEDQAIYSMGAGAITRQSSLIVTTVTTA